MHRTRPTALQVQAERRAWLSVQLIAVSPVPSAVLDRQSPY